MSLTDWERNGWLIPHATSRQEIGDLLALVQRDLRDCQSEDLSADWRFNIAYNAALQSAKAALCAAGYRVAKGGDGHHRTLESLTLTAGVAAETVRSLGVYRRRRNMVEYDHAGITSDGDVDEMRALALTLHDQVSSWLAAQHPDLVGPPRGSG